jgi:hypothetical protein
VHTTADALVELGALLFGLGILGRLAGRIGISPVPLYLLGGLAFRFAWVAAGRTSANDDETVARVARVRAGDLGREQA